MQWKNVQAFSAHYLRLNAAKAAGDKIQAWVHNSSPRGSAEPEGSHTPARETEPGGRDPEGEAQDWVSPKPPSPLTQKSKKTPPPSFACLA